MNSEEENQGNNYNYNYNYSFFNKEISKNTLNPIGNQSTIGINVNQKRQDIEEKHGEYFNISSNIPYYTQKENEEIDFLNQNEYEKPNKKTSNLLSNLLSNFSLNERKNTNIPSFISPINQQEFNYFNTNSIYQAKIQGKNDQNQGQFLIKNDNEIDNYLLYDNKNEQIFNNLSLNTMYQNPLINSTQFYNADLPSSNLRNKNQNIQINNSFDENNKINYINIINNFNTELSQNSNLNLNTYSNSDSNSPKNESNSDGQKTKDTSYNSINNANMINTKMNLVTNNQLELVNPHLNALNEINSIGEKAKNYNNFFNQEFNNAFGNYNLINNYSNFNNYRNDMVGKSSEECFNTFAELKLFTEKNNTFITRYIQSRSNNDNLIKLLFKLSPIDFDLLLTEILPKIKEILIFNNKFSQKLLEKCTFIQRMKIIKKIKNDFIEISLNKWGSFSIQSLIKSMSQQEEQKSILKIINSNISLLALDPNGNFIIQKILMTFSEKNTKIIIDELIEIFDELIKNNYCLNLIKGIIILNKSNLQKLKIIGKIIDNINYIITDEYLSNILMVIFDKWEQSLYKNLIEIIFQNALIINDYRLGYIYNEPAVKVIIKCVQLSSNKMAVSFAKNLAKTLSIIYYLIEFNNNFNNFNGGKRIIYEIFKKINIKKRKDLFILLSKRIKNIIDSNQLNQNLIKEISFEFLSEFF